MLAGTHVHEGTASYTVVSKHFSEYSGQRNITSVRRHRTHHRHNVTRALYLEVWCGQHQASSLPYPQQRLRLPHTILAHWCFVKMGWVNRIILRQISDTSVLIRCPLKWCMVGILTQGHSFFSTMYNTSFSHHVAHFQSTCMGPNDDIQWLNLSLCFDAEWTV